MSDNETTAEILAAKEAEVLQRLKRIATLRAEEAEIRAYLDESTGELRARIASLKTEKERVEGEIALHENSIRESEPEAYTQLDQLSVDIKKAEEQVKAICHALPVEALKAGRKITGNGYSVSISKASAHREFKTEAMLKAHPEFASMEVEGDKLVVPSIDAGVLDRLVAMGTISEDDVAPFTVVVKDKSPSVTITPVDAAKS